MSGPFEARVFFHQLFQAVTGKADYQLGVVALAFASDDCARPIFGVFYHCTCFCRGFARGGSLRKDSFRLYGRN